MTHHPSLSQSAPLDMFFRPRSIAVIGASRDPDSMAGTLWRNILRTFRGPAYAVNPRTNEIEGRRTYPSVLDIPDDVELAVIVVPAVHVINVARECLRKRVRGIVVVSAGFAETGAAGAARQAELASLVRDTGVRMVGPNCLGLINTDPEHSLNATFGLPQSPAGNVAVASQSGALGFVLPESMRQWRVGISQMVSMGNKLDVAENDLIEHWEHDDRTGVIQLYLESFQDPQGFLEAARRISRSKPIVAIKAGRETAGIRAAGSHTAALASPAAAADGLFRQAGVIAVDSLTELFETTALLALQPLPAGRRVAVLTNAGGPGVLCTDALEASGLLLPEFSERLQAQLREFVPAEASVRNPIDLIGMTDPLPFRRSLELLLSSSEIDSIIVIYIPRLAHTTPAIVAVVETAATCGTGKPVLAVLMDAEQDTPREPAGADESERPQATAPEPTRVPRYRYPEEAARALRRVSEYAEWQSRPVTPEPHWPLISADAAAELTRIATSRTPREPAWLPFEDVMLVLQYCGLTVPAWSVALSEEQVVASAMALGFPVVLKALSPLVLHKSDVGGVVLDVRTPDEARAACHRFRDRLPGATGVLVQRYIPEGVETLVGVQRDPQFGHLIGFGIGGTLVEAVRDVHFRMHPLTARDAEELIQESLAARLLSAHRGRPASDVAALRTALLRVSALLTALPQISEFDLNPLTVLPAGRGICVLDARIRLGLADGREECTR